MHFPHSIFIMAEALASCGWVEALNSLAKESINSVDLISFLAEVGWLGMVVLVVVFVVKLLSHLVI